MLPRKCLPTLSSGTESSAETQPFSAKRIVLPGRRPIYRRTCSHGSENTRCPAAYYTPSSTHLLSVFIKEKKG